MTPKDDTLTSRTPPSPALEASNTSGKWAFRPEHPSRPGLGPGLMGALVPVPMARSARGARPGLVPVQMVPLVPVGDTNRD